MPCIITSVHDPAVLAETCRRLGLRLPQEGSVQLGATKAYGWIVCLLGLYAPIVFDALTGLVAYHPRDNAFVPYGRVMRFILRYYDVHAAWRRGRSVQIDRLHARKRRQVAAKEVA